MISHRFVARLARQVALVKYNLLPIPGHPSIPLIFSGFVLLNFIFQCSIMPTIVWLCPVSCGHCIVCPSIYDFWLLLCNLQTFLACTIIKLDYHLPNVWDKLQDWNSEYFNCQFDIIQTFFYLCSIQTKGIQNAQNGNLQTFPLATTQLVFVKGLLIVKTVSSLMSFIKWRNSFIT
jgi:hypothetical protein